ncbi:PhoB family transcriptional regulator [Heyndrickxia shackletonii]|uniref:PhoB family transcriptional regulator n=1 Tax=Heyndrickxia shackletonii TaxID=157838 RepID=A0A0Q3X0E1_9BACI|nr:response regulator transcription factor [Heyndrickxia shackletonii]KQL55307.1 PhoB family transcriptional regulator [Heyndrickxia shackletonii]MBB2479206.1 response regulator transcription factor [Bacillus sp. APMAM]NEY99011.1 response regulator transcription factor [Heyndrickxia shackletonii]RTZ57178.1 response regulator transcription factor [Bacillus sp. SAJ1]
MNLKNILVVDDEKEIVNLVSIYLQNDGFTVFKAYDGEEALDMFAQKKIDLIILDLMMPKLDGMEVCRRLRETNTVPILMLSAKAEDMDKVLGLMTGADDYMIKPFNPLELIARVKSLLRRSYQFKQVEQEEQSDLLNINSLEINRASHTVLHNGKPITLTSKEFEILYLLASNRSRVFSTEEIFERVWEEKYFASNNTVMVHISNLREKLEKELGYKLIKTVWGVGYKIEE